MKGAVTVIDSSYVENMSRYRLNADFTMQQFNQFVGIAQGRFNREDPGLATAEGDYCVALLVCHQIFRVASGANDRKSASSGDESYTRLTDPEGNPASPYLVEYQQVITGRVILPSQGVERADIDTSSAFRLANLRIARVDYTDNARQLRPRYVP